MTTQTPVAQAERLQVARTDAEVEALREPWEALGTSYVDAELDYFMALVRTRPEVLRPHVAILERDGVPAALVVGRIERVPFACRIGYKTVYRPTLRALRVAHGGVTGANDEQTAAALVRGLERALASGEADVLVLPAVPVNSPLERALSEIPSALRRQHFVEPSVHRRLVLPETYDELLARRDRKSRYNLKRQSTQLEKTFGDELTIDVLRDVADYDRIFADLEPVAAKTYQRGLGAGFADTAERRALVHTALERGWFRAWVLSIGGNPVAFWQGNGRNGTFFVSSTGYDPEYARDGVGTYLQLRMFADLCADPEIEIVDFGWGDADYKARFGNESWYERDVVVFAPTFRGLRTSVFRTAIMAVDRSARRLLSRMGLTTRVKKHWRGRLRPSMS